MSLEPVDSWDDDPLAVYLHLLVTIPPLTGVEETELWVHVRARDPRAESAHKRLVEANLHLVVPIAQRHSPGATGVLDLIQRGNEGLMRAVDTFAAVSNSGFADHATASVEQAISKALAELPPPLQ